MSAGRTTPVQPGPDSSPGCPPLLLAGHPEPVDRSGGRATGRSPPRWADPGRPEACSRAHVADRDGSVITSKRGVPALGRGPRAAGGTGAPAGDVVGPGAGPAVVTSSSCALPVLSSVALSQLSTWRGSPVPVAHRGLLPWSGRVEWARVLLRGVLKRRHATGGMRAPPGSGPDG